MKRTSSLIIGLTLFFALTGGALYGSRSHRVVASSATTFDGGLKLGEYACYGSGGNVLIGLGFKVLAGNKYTDLDGKEHGTFSIQGDTVTFHGGHLDGQVGKNLKDYKFTIHSAPCEPFSSK